MSKEYQKLNYGPIPGEPFFGPINNEELSSEDRKKSLEVVNLIKQKRCWKIKGRIFSNGSQQKSYLKEDESVYYTTWSTESLMSTLLFDAMEQRDVAVFNIPVAYLQTEILADKLILLLKKYEFVDIVCEFKHE